MTVDPWCTWNFWREYRKKKAPRVVEKIDMKIMKPVIEEAVDWLFEDSMIDMKSMVCDILGAPEHFNAPLKSLKFLAMKASMESRMIGDFYGKILFRLAFQEEIDPYNILYPGARSYAGAEPEKQFKQNPHVFLALIDQNRIEYTTSLQIVLGKTNLQIRNNNKTIAMIANRNGYQFDPFWAGKFFALFVRKGLSPVSVKLEGAGNTKKGNLKNVLNNIVQSANPVLVKGEKAKKGLEEQGRNVYSSNYNSASSGLNCIKFEEAKRYYSTSRYFVFE